MNNLPIYNTEEIKDDAHIRYLFESAGKKSIIKAIQYSPVTVLGGRTVYNLGFGDYDEESGTIIDDVNSNNGDIYTVFNTVLNTVPLFFNSNPEAVIVVSGSDGHTDFIKDCLPSCEKKCNDICKKFQRRIKTYRYYVDKNFEALCQDFIFFGRNRSKENTFVQYIPMQQYDDILIYKKK